VLAELAKGVPRRKIPALRQALRGRFTDHHALLIGLCLDHTTHLEAAITRLDQHIDTLFAAHTSEAGVPSSRPVTGSTPVTVTGFGKRAAETIIAEIGVDMSRFPTAAHLPSWTGVAPGNNITGGKRGSGKTTKGDVWLIDILTQCAWPPRTPATLGWAAALGPAHPRPGAGHPEQPLLRRRLRVRPLQLPAQRAPGREHPLRDHRVADGPVAGPDP